MAPSTSPLSAGRCRGCSGRDPSCRSAVAPFAAGSGAVRAGCDSPGDDDETRNKSHEGNLGELEKRGGDRGWVGPLRHLVEQSPIDGDRRRWTIAR